MSRQAGDGAERARKDAVRTSSRGAAREGTETGSRRGAAGEGMEADNSRGAAREETETGSRRGAAGEGTETGSSRGTPGEGTKADSLSVMIQEAFSVKRQDVRSYSPLPLAYIGDAVYDLVIRTAVVERANRPANILHRITVKYVSAGAQARIVTALQERFTEEEQTVYQRGKNAKSHTTAKNASPEEYSKATGFEAVLGWLYLKNDVPRILELVKEGIRAAGIEGP